MEDQVEYSGIVSVDYIAKCSYCGQEAPLRTYNMCGQLLDTDIFFGTDSMLCIECAREKFPDWGY